MSGGGAHEAGRPSTRPRAWIGLAVGIVAVSGALAAVLHGGGGGAASEPAGGPGAGSERTRWDHEWPASHVGPVWITVDAPDDETRTVVIRWGPWRRQVIHHGAEPATYVFRKNVTPPGESTVPTTVHVNPGAEVTFGSGTPPAGAVDVNADWTPASGEPEG